MGGEAEHGGAGALVVCEGLMHLVHITGGVHELEGCGDGEGLLYLMEKV